MKKLNWQIWTGFVVSVIAAISYGFLFVRWPLTREFPWANLVLFAMAFVLLFAGVRRAFKPGKSNVAKIFSCLAAAFGVLMLAALLFLIFVMGSWLPKSAGAPQVGQKAPDFTLADSEGRTVSLSQLLASSGEKLGPPKSVLLIFYRGYW